MRSMLRIYQHITIFAKGDKLFQREACFALTNPSTDG